MLLCNQHLTGIRNIAHLFLKHKCYVVSIPAFITFVSYGRPCNGNRTEWSPIRSLVTREMTKSGDRAVGVRFDLYITWYDCKPNLTTRSYQLIIKIITSEKRGIAKL